MTRRGTRRARRGRWPWGLVGLALLGSTSLWAAPIPADGTEALGERLVRAFEAELGLTRQAVALERAVATLERDRAGAEHAAVVLDHAGREGLRRLDAYGEGRSQREALARQRARALVKVARGGIARIVLDDGDDHDRSGAARLARGRDLRWLVRHDLRELSAYQRAEQRAGDELLHAERQLQALSVLATVHDVQEPLVAAARQATGAALARAQQEREALRDVVPWHARIAQSEPERLETLKASRAELDRLRREGDPLTLLRPVRGRLVGRFGGYTDPILRLPMVRNGVELAARRDEAVHAPADGRVVMVSELPGFDQVVVIDHGGGRLTMLGRLWKVTVAEGERVEAGTAIASAAPKVLDDGLGTTVYLELRHGDAPVDPEPLLRRRRR